LITILRKGREITKKGFCNERGAIFSLDAAIAFTITLFAIIAFCTMLANYSSATIQNENEFLLQQKTMAVADSFVKNYNPTNALLGACIIDSEKKRVKENELSSLNFANINPLKAGEFFVRNIGVRLVSNGNLLFSKVLDAREENNCLTVKRFALVDGQTAAIEIQGCLNE